MLTFLAQAIYYVFFIPASFFVSLTGSMLDYVVQIDNFDVPVVQIGWQIVRDISNMGFILILLLIAFGTIFGVQKYSAKSLLPKLIAGAMLINFSKTFAFLFINLSQILMRSFLAPFGVGTGANLASKLKLEQSFIKLSGTMASNGTIDKDRINGSYISGIIFAAIFMFIAAVIFFVYSIVLIVRVVALWILVVLSPLAVIFFIVPGRLEKYANKWLDNFFEQAMVGPAVAFFLYLALVTGETVGSITLANGSRTLSSISTKVPGASNALAGNMNMFLQFVFVAAFLWGGLVAAKTLSSASVQALNSAKKGALNRAKNMLKTKPGKKPWGKTKAVAKAPLSLIRGGKNLGDAAIRGGKALATKPGETLGRAWKGAVAGVKNKAGAAWRTVVEGTFGSAAQNFAKQNVETNEQLDEMKKQGLWDMGQFMPYIMRDAQSGNKDDRRRAQASLISLANAGKQEDFVFQMTEAAFDDSSDHYNEVWAGDIRQAYADMNGISPAAAQTAFDAGNLALDPRMFGEIVKARFGYEGQSDKKKTETANLLSAASGAAFKTGNIAYGGLAGANKKTGRMEASSYMPDKATLATNPTKAINDATKEYQKTIGGMFGAKGANQSAAELRVDNVLQSKNTFKTDPTTGKTTLKKVEAAISAAGKKNLEAWTSAHTKSLAIDGKGQTLTMFKKIAADMEELNSGTALTGDNAAERSTIAVQMSALVAKNAELGRMLATAAGKDIKIDGNPPYNPRGNA